jgi:hypothetical protein
MIKQDYGYLYSEKEIALFRLFPQFVMSEWIYNPHLPPYLLYRELALLCFKEDDTDSCRANSVRRCLIACEEAKIFRCTEEFDALIVVLED